ncbi:MAG: 4Fe-4S binding protein [Candidatus Heimdallarchaeota archaeon]|nr:4Fe-4S binding protein [Candidatus Heimdallarchaeota archaeon]MCK4955379.1 4Fe-4S binding protein [Candidatus Heimdallarchaeota archaeon]
MTKEPSLPILYPMEGSAGRTGDWRTQYPVLDPEKCIKCNICWKFCPDNAIYPADREKDQTITYDYEYCKGCGICATECPKQAIIMVNEGE